MSAGADWIVQRYVSLPSTMDQAAMLARFGARERTVVVSEEQTHGRGRAGRAWQAPLGSALFCTIITRPEVAPAHLCTLPLLTGVAVAEAIEAATGCPVTLKWPNDVWCGTDAARRKVAGVLLQSSLRETRIDYVLIGIGVNLTGNAAALPAGATSIEHALSVPVEANTLLTLLMERFDHRYKAFLAREERPSLDAWRARAALLGETITIEHGGGSWHGQFLGVDDAGALLLRQEDGSVQRVVAGDLVRGPQPQRQPG